MNAPRPGDVVRYSDSEQSDVPAYREWRARVVTVCGPIAWVVTQPGLYWPGKWSMHPTQAAYLTVEIPAPF